jgi:dihydropteroate synthase
MAHDFYHWFDNLSPLVMGILNVTPDSFFDGGKRRSVDEFLSKAGKLVSDGATIIDIGAVSTRPGADEVSEEEELGRLLPVLKEIRKRFPEMIISVDTFRSNIARIACGEGADIINDIYGGRFNKDMLATVAACKVPYILMHMKGTPADMQRDPVYSDVVAEVYYFFGQRIEQCRSAGISQIIIDPGFGFGKNLTHNFTLLAELSKFRSLGAPILAGLSRKSMIQRTLGVPAAEALNGTTALNMSALINGASILRVHDVKEAVETVKLYRALRTSDE